MKIGVDASDLATGRADGTTRYTFELAKHLPRVGADVRWHFFAPRPLADTRYKIQSKNVAWHASPWPKWWTQLRLPWDLYHYRPDVLFMPIQQLPIVRPGTMKTAAVIHDLAVHYFPDQFTRKDWLLLHTFSAQAAREAEALICVSQATADDVATFYGRTENVHVIHHGVDHGQFRLPTTTEKETSHRRLQEKYPPLTKPYILFVGQLQPRKNLVRLIESFEQLAKTEKDLQLAIAGSHGWLQEPITRRAQASKYAERIHLIGRVPDELLPALYWQAEVCVLPSLYEGFGMPLVEAMACGCPVVTANVSSLPEVAGSAAVLVDPFDVQALVDGISSARERREELREAGIARAAEFSWEHTAARTLQVLADLLH